MKSRGVFIAILVSLLFVFSSYAQQNDFPVLKGPYLGQKPPGTIPEIFAPGILNSISMIHGRISFSPNGSEVFWSCNAAPVQSRWFMKHNNAGEWSLPKKSFFSIEYNENMLSYSSDGNRIFFHSRRPLLGNGSPKDKDIWYRDRSGEGWSDPLNIGSSVNSSSMDESSPSIAENNTIYFCREEYNGIHGSSGHAAGQSDIYYSQFIRNKYLAPLKFGTEINSNFQEIDPIIAPDNSFILFSSNRPGGYSSMMNLYVSFNRRDGTWTEAQCLSNEFKIENIWFPSISSDGKYIFFCGGLPTSKGYTNSHYYWVDAKIIEKLKPDELK